MLTPISGDAEFHSVKNTNHTVCIMFTATWCGPCQSLKPSIQHIERIYTVDVDDHQNQGVVEVHSVETMPTFLFFKSGKQIARFSGAGKAAVTYIQRMMGA